MDHAPILQNGISDLLLTSVFDFQLDVFWKSNQSVNELTDTRNNTRLNPSIYNNMVVNESIYYFSFKQNVNTFY